MRTNKKKKAFTLTELLVVVIIIGVLSAVVLPKFNKIVETRKTTEAEELMAAVRTEQEKRCALDKDYLIEVTELTEVLPTDTTKNFTYTLTSTGIKASSKGKYAYELQMPSYAAGRICCENETECLKLNKDYPLCSELLAKADYDDGTACAGTVVAPPPVYECSGPSTQTCGCNNAGVQTRTCNTSTGEWSAWSACDAPATCTCSGTKPATSQTCNSCGRQTRTVSCDTSTGEWSVGSWGACSVKDSSFCNCTHPVDLGLGAFPDYGSCCINGDIYSLAGVKVDIEQHNNGLCCNYDCSNATVYDDGSRMGCTCKSGGSSSGGGSSSTSCPSPSSFEKIADCGARTCSALRFDPCSRSCCNCSVSISSETRVSDDGGCLIKGTVYYQ